MIAKAVVIVEDVGDLVEVHAFGNVYWLVAFSVRESAVCSFYKQPFYYFGSPVVDSKMQGCLIVRVEGVNLNLRLSQQELHHRLASGLCCLVEKCRFLSVGNVKRHG